MARRPRPGEEDLDAMMAEFESGRSQPAASVTKRAAPPSATLPGEAKKTKSKFARDRDGTTAGGRDGQEEAAIRLEPPVDVVSQLVLRGIVERNVEGVVVRPPDVRQQQHQDFPPIIKLASTKVRNNEAGKPSKRSIFAQQFLKMKSGLSAMDIDEMAAESKAPAACIAGSDDFWLNFAADRFLIQ